jgi:hypothetical protein
VDPETDKLVLCPVTCKRWGCPYCAVRKIRKLSFLTNAAKPNRWIRIGVRPQVYDSAKECWERTSRLVPELFRRLRGIQQGAQYEYLRVCELHTASKKYVGYGAEAKGFPHYHLLLRTPFISQHLLSYEWASLTAPTMPPDTEVMAEKHGWMNRRLECKHLSRLEDRQKPASHQELAKAWRLDLGAPNVHIAKIDQTFSSFRYMVKYLTKLHRLEWTDRHVSYSRNFFTEESKEKLAFPERAILRKDDEHPWVYLQRRYAGEQIGLDANGCYHLPYEFCGLPADADRKTVGLPMRPEETPPPPPKHVQTMAFETQKDVSYYDENF